MTVSLDIENKNNEVAQKRIAILEEKLEQTHKVNDALNQELQVASKTIVRINALVESLEESKIIF